MQKGFIYHFIQLALITLLLSHLDSHHMTENIYHSVFHLYYINFILKT